MSEARLRFGFSGFCLLTGIVTFAIQQGCSVTGNAPSWIWGTVWFSLAIILVVVAIWRWDQTASHHWIKKVVLTMVAVALMGGFSGYQIIKQYRVEHPKTGKPTQAQLNLANLWIAWGVVPPRRLQVMINTDPLLPVKDKFQMVLIARVDDNTIDSKLDTKIEKSSLFSIYGGSLAIEMEPSQTFPYQHGRRVELLIVLLPNGVGPSRVSKFADVEKLGGYILPGKSFIVIPGTK